MSTFKHIRSEDNMVKGMHVSIFRDADGRDCTNGGATSLAKDAILIGEGLPDLFAPKSGQPVLRVVKRNIGGKTYVHAVPVDAETGEVDSTKWYMFGGNFIFTSDSRYTELISQYPIAVHDRTEK